MGATRRLGLVLLTAGMVAGSLAVATGPSALGAPPPCRVRNVTQETFGRSLIRMVERARDGDRLLVRGTCSGQVVVREDLRIVGVADGATVTGRDRRRAVRVNGPASVSIRRLTIEHGATSGGGGGILMRAGATVRLVDAVVRRNTAAYGAGICCKGTLHLIRSIVAANLGGGIYSNDGTVTVTDSAVRRNMAVNGGGIVTSGTITLVGSTVWGNRSEDEGGGIANGGTLTLTDTTVSGNRSGVDGGGIYNLDGTVTLTDSFVRANRARLGGGGIHSVAFQGNASILLIDSTVRDNSARTLGGGGVRNIEGDVSLDASTVTGNSAGTQGGGIENVLGTVTLDATSSVTDNTPDDCVGTPAC